MSIQADAYLKQPKDIAVLAVVYYCRKPCAPIAITFAVSRKPHPSPPRFFFLTSDMKQNFHRLTTRLLERHIPEMRNQPLNNSFTSPLAQIETLCQADGPGGRLTHDFKTNIDRMRKESEKLYYLYLFMISSACRISEALKIKHSDITNTGHVKLKTSKGGKTRIVSGGEAMQFLVSMKNKNRNPFEPFDRFFVYKRFKKYGIILHLQGRKKATVTHAPRHIVAQSIQKEKMSIEMSKQALGHKSIKSTSHYHGKD